MKVFVVAVALFAFAAAEDGKLEKRGSAGYAYGAPVAAPVAVATYKSGAPVGYSNSINAAAIRNVETVGVTKTITPVVTKTTTYNTHSEPAVSVGHVQGYSQSAHGAPKVAPVQFTTQYTSYLNPTVGVNGPVTYSGPAYSTGLAVAPVAAHAPVAAAQVAQPVGYAGYAAQPFGYAASPLAAYGNYGYAGLGYAAHPGLLGYSGYPQFAAAYAQPAYAYAQPAVAAASYAAPAHYAAQAYAAPAHSYAAQAHYAAPAHSYAAAPAQSYGSPAVVSSQTYAAPSVTTSNSGYSKA